MKYVLSFDNKEVIQEIKVRDGHMIKNTITGIKGFGGLQTRGKYKEEYHKSLYI